MMLFLTLPLAFLLAWGFSYLPGFACVAPRALRAAYGALSRIMERHAGMDGRALAPVLMLVLVTGLACLFSALLEAVYPLLPCVLLAPLIYMPMWLREALAQRRELEGNSCHTDEERAAYESRVIDAISFVAQHCARSLFLPLLVVCILLPLHLGVAAAWCFFALEVLKDDCAWLRRIDRMLSRAGDTLFIALVIPTAALCGTEMGMAARARQLGAQAVLLSAVGVDPALKRGHRPVTGDISQACLCVCVATALLYAVGTVPVVLLLSQFGWTL